MKRKVFITFLVVVLLIPLAKGQDTVRYAKYRDFVDHVTHVFKDNHPDLRYLKYRVFTPTLNIFDFYTGLGRDSLSDAVRYFSMLSELDASNYGTSDTGKVKYMINCLTNSATRGIIPISMSLIEYSQFKDSAIYFGYVGFSNGAFTENAPNGFYPFRKNRLFAASSLSQVSYTSDVKFLINDSFINSNIPNVIDSIYIDFADGNGLIPVIKGNVYTINYSMDGLKTLNVKIKADTSYYNSFFTFYDSSSVGNGARGGGNTTSGCNTPTTLPDELRHVFVPSVKGILPIVTGKYGIWYSTCGNNVTNPSYLFGAGGIYTLVPTVFSPQALIRKPYIISVGFNPGNGKQLLPNHFGNTMNFLFDFITIEVPFGGWGGDWRGTYYETINGALNDRLDPSSGCPNGTDNGGHYLDRLRAEGYDIIIVQYDNGTDYIENNAEIFKQVIRDINQEKQNNDFFFENIVSGYSAGSVTSRLALAQLEAEFRAGGPHPHTKTWVSIEGEMQGANVPLGLQFFLDYQSNPGNLLPKMLTLNPLANLADGINMIVANVANVFNKSTTAKQLTPFTSGNPNGPLQERNDLLSAFASVPGNSSNGYPEFVRRVGSGNGSGSGVNVPHSPASGTNALLDAQLGFLNNASGPATSLPHSSSCAQNYTWHVPNTGKTTTAYWWNSGSTNVFNGYTFIDWRTTITPMFCVNGHDVLPAIACDLCGCCDNCSCIGPGEPGNYILISNEVEPKPANPVNWDDVPGSTLSTHLELYGKVNGGGNSQSTYPFYNNVLANSIGGNTYARVDPTMHAFAPVVSTLDLHDPSTGQPANNFTTPTSLGLMFTRPGVQEPNQSFGYPFINHPSNHFQITPFDAVYAIGFNTGFLGDGHSPRPANQMHVEDPQRAMLDYFVRTEVAPLDLFLSNRFVGNTFSGPCSLGCYTAEFEARNSIIVGNGIYGINANQNFLTPDGDFGTTNNSKVILHAPDISLLPGSDFSNGEADIFIQSFACSTNPDYRISNNSAGKGNGKGSNSMSSAGDNIQTAPSAVHAQKAQNIRVYPNPTSGLVSVERESEDQLNILISDINGKVVHSSSITGSINTVDVSALQNGVYLFQAGEYRFKIMIAK